MTRSFAAPEPVRSVAPLPAPPTFSVIVAAFQAAHVIREAVASALDQTVAPLEVVVCDDGSSDDLAGALAGFGDRVHLLRRPHGGEAAAKNAAAAAARGEWLLILDADDVFAPDRLEALSELAVARPDLDILTTDAHLEAGGRVVRRCYHRDWPFELADQRRGILERNFVFGLAAVRRARLLSHGGFDESIRFTTDWDLWIRLILDGARAGCVMEPLARYRVRPTALSARRTDMTRGKIQTLEKAARNSTLQPEEAEALASALAAHRRDLALAEARDAAAGGRSEARARGWSLAVAPGVAPRARVEGALIAAVPSLAGHWLRRRAARWWVGAGGVRVRARPPRRGPLRLVVYSDSREFGGAEASLGHLIAALPRETHITVAGVERRVVERLAARRPGVTVRQLPPGAGATDVRALVAHVRAFRSLRPHVLHANLASPWAAQHALVAAALLRVRSVAVYQLAVPARSPRQARAKRLTSRWVDAHVGVGPRTSREIERLLHLSPRSVRTIHNGVPDAARPACGRRASPTIGSVGRLAPQKGFDILLRALASLPDEVGVVLVGDGPSRAALQALAGGLGVAERVEWTGWSERARDRLAELDVFVLASRFEGFPLVVLEALLAELPVVACDVGDVSDAVIPGRTGRLVSPEDPQALASTLGELLADPDQRKRLGRAGRELVLERFTAGGMARAFAALHIELAP